VLSIDKREMRDVNVRLMKSVYAKNTLLIRPQYRRDHVYDVAYDVHERNALGITRLRPYNAIWSAIRIEQALASNRSPLRRKVAEIVVHIAISFANEETRGISSQISIY